MKKKTGAAVLAVLLAGMLSVCVSACSAPSPGGQSNADTTAQIKNDNDKVNHAVTPPVSGETPATSYSISGRIKKPGDVIQEISIEKSKVVPDAVEYVVTKAMVFPSCTEAGIQENQTDLTEYRELCGADGKLKPGVKFLLVEMTVKNRRVPTNLNVTSVLLRYSASPETENTMGFISLPLPAYFSNPLNRKNGKDYYSYSLAVGQSRDIKVGWYVDTEKYSPSKLYLLFNQYQDEYRQIVKLGL